MRFTFFVTSTILCALVVLCTTGLTSLLIINCLASSGEKEMVTRERELAKVLAGLRTGTGQLDFNTLARFVGSSDKAATGLIYALVTDERGALRNGTLNPRLFATLDPEYARHMTKGRQRVLQLLAAGKIDRHGTIKEYNLPVPGGLVRLGFDLTDTDRQVRGQQRLGYLFLVLGLACGALASILVGHRLASPLRQLARAMTTMIQGTPTKLPPLSSPLELATMSKALAQLGNTRDEIIRLHELFERYLSPAIAQRILREKNPLELVTEERAATVLSLSFAGFSELVRRSTLREALHLLNECWPAVLEVMTKHQGTIIELQGPRALVIWGVPNDPPDPEQSAMQAALAAKQVAEKQGRIHAAAGNPALHLRQGLNTGRVIAGNVGSAQRVSYHVLGGTVELARQIEKHAAANQILLSEGIYAKVQQLIETTPGPPLQLADRETISLFQLVATTSR